MLQLNLSNNQIEDKGAFHLANVIRKKNSSRYTLFNSIFKALRLNRTLLTLNLSNNKIGDNGAQCFANVIEFQSFSSIIHK